MDAAMKVGAPVIGLNDSVARASRRAWRAPAAMPKCSSATPASVCHPADQPDHGPCRAVYSPAMTDFIFMVKDSSWRSVRHRARRGEDGDQRGSDARGTGRGRHPHHQVGRRRCCVWRNDIDALLATRDFFDFLPLSNRHDIPERPCADPWDRLEDSLDTLIPPSANYQGHA